MVALGALIPVAVLGTIVWVVLLLTRQRTYPFTLATATSLYAHWMTIAGATMTLSGVAVGIKLLLAQVQKAWAYYVPSPIPCQPYAAKCVSYTPPNGVSDQIRSDLVAAIVLVVIGAVVLGFHYALVRALRSRPGGANPLVLMGTLIAFTALYGVTAVVGLAAALYGILNYALATASSTPGPFADAVGVAVAFAPAWVYAALRLLAATRHAGPEPAAAH
jgi:hypothetical protein